MILHASGIYTVHLGKSRATKDPGIQGHCLWIVRVFLIFSMGIPDIEQSASSLEHDDKHGIP